jgi:hypothetical protein
MENNKNILPCPFCGRYAEFENVNDNYGTFYEYDCYCGLSHVSIQICDLMTIDERKESTFKNDRYESKYRERARNKAIEIWNNRTHIVQQRLSSDSKTQPPT